jgi:hypothetical protein
MFHGAFSVTGFFLATRAAKKNAGVKKPAFPKMVSYPSAARLSYWLLIRSVVFRPILTDGLALSGYERHVAPGR